MTQRMRTVAAALVYLLVLAFAIGSVLFATRKSSASPTTPAMRAREAAAADAPQPVTLTPTESQRIGVTYAVATVGPFGQEVRTVGQVVLDETRVRSITLKVDGWVDQLVVNATGQYVTQGQPLLTLYSPMLVAAEDELLLAEHLQRDVAMGAADARQNAGDLVAAARRRLAYWDVPERDIAEVEQGGQPLKTATVRAPVGGYVLEKNVLAGQKVMAGDLLYKVADLSTVWVEGEVFEQDLASVRVGQSVQAEFESLPGNPQAGHISYVYPILNPDTRTARVRVVLPNGNLRLKPGMYATIRIAGTQRAGVLTVPRSAVLSTGERNIVFVREANGQLTPREVAIGASGVDRIEVLRGLTAGQTVVASATFLIDAESNLGKALGGMGNMPGMDMTTPPTPLPKGRE